MARSVAAATSASKSSKISVSRGSAAGLTSTPAPILDRAPGRPSLLAVEQGSMGAGRQLDKWVAHSPSDTFDVTGAAVVHRMSTTPGTPAGLASWSSAVRSPGRTIIGRATYARLI